MKKLAVLFSVFALVFALCAVPAFADGSDSPDSDSGAAADGAAGGASDSKAAATTSKTTAAKRATVSSTKSPKTGIDLTGTCGVTAVLLLGAGVAVLKLRQRDAA